ncbi:MAG TPA: response regulator [Spirochaetota bacterium]|nr:response regulator [Spirochaetota bacterium]HOS32378.1 response regulator [Spirochaetota bacterium]HOS55625.1 response regulator [Spirochaetota bacterium]HQF78137.1 response regulator [Spirochaetota bacterium]HQH30049.1 response regulator [Spirochaetota bacterium]
MKKILVVQSSELLRRYICEKLEKLGFEVLSAKDGFDGLIKLKNAIPDLVIMDLVLNRLSGMDFIREKKQYKNVSDIPVILLSNKIDRLIIERLIFYKVTKIISKPVKVDLLFNAVSETLKVPIDIDDSYSLIDIHLNEDLLFVEISGGFNKDKIEIAQYKIIQLLESSKIKYPKILIIITDIEFNQYACILLELLMNCVTEATNTPISFIKILTGLPFVKECLALSDSYKNVEITEDIKEALNSLGKGDVFAFGKELDNLISQLLSQVSEKNFEEVLDFKFSTESDKDLNSIVRSPDDKFNIAIVDDDLHILEYIATVLSENNWNILIYDTGKSFLDDFKKNIPDLVFLDLMMPDVNGFEIMQRFRSSGFTAPIVVVTAMVEKEYILKAKKYGATSYMTKPLSSEVIINKTYNMLKIKK